MPSITIFGINVLPNIFCKYVILSPTLFFFFDSVPPSHFLLLPPSFYTSMVLYHNPNKLGCRKYLHLLSHQRHIAYYLGCIFHTYTVVGFTVVPQEFLRTIASYLEESDKDAGFLIDLGDTYQVVYNRRASHGISS